MGVSLLLAPAPDTFHTTLSDMASKVVLAALLALGHSSPVAQYAPAPYPAEAAYPDIKPSYNYQFGVNDPEYSGAVFSHQENREDYNTQGEYRVNLPDGRVQIVSYTAGPEGYVADVTYEGTAVYPEETPYKPAPAYAPAPAPVVKVAPAPAPYKPAPVVKVAPAPVVYKPAPVPVVKVAPAPVVYKPAPVVKVAPAPVVYKPAPVYHKPAPVYHKPAPVYHKPAPVYHRAPAYTPKRYGYSVVTTTAAPVAEPAAKEAPVVEEEAAEAPAPVEEAAPKTEEDPAPAYDAPAATEAAPAAERYRYYRY